MIDAKYQPITLIVSNAAPGQNITVLLQGQDSAQVQWSLGAPLESGSGLALNIPSGCLPLADLSINTAWVNLVISAGGGHGGPLAFSLQLSLAASEALQTLALTSQSDPGVVVQAALGDSQPQVLGNNPTVFDWSPQ